MAVGAGLRLGGLKAAPALAAAFLAIRHTVLPAVAIGLTAALALPAEQRMIVVLFAALPTASSAYVLAARMGGDGSYVAGLVTGCRPRALLPKDCWHAARSSRRRRCRRISSAYRRHGVRPLNRW